MKRNVLSILSTLVLGAALGACRSSPEPERAPAPTEPPTERSERSPTPMEQPRVEQPDEPGRPGAMGQTGQTEQMETPSTETLQTSIQSALASAEGLDATQIQVEVREEGVVYLTGTVASEEEKRRAHEIAHAVQGVRNVYLSGLEVDTSQATR